MLPDNERVLKAYFPNILNELYGKKEQIIEEEARNGQKTLAIMKDNKKIYLHSKYNPQREAEKIIESLDIDDQASVIFYGTGIGYHILSILEKHKKIKS